MFIGYGMLVDASFDGTTNDAWFVAPAPSTEFIVGVPVSTTIGAYIDGDYEFAFTSDFANVRGTITVASGTGTGNVTAQAGDIGETTLYVRPVGGSAALATLACTVVAGVTLDSPAAGATFYTGEAQSVSLTASDDTYETSWQSDFTTTNGDIVVSGGTGSGNVTAAWADAAASRATLYVRSKTLGGAALVSQSAPLFTSPHQAVIAEGYTVESPIDFHRSAQVTESPAGYANAVALCPGYATDADVVQQATEAKRPAWNALTECGGRYGIVGNADAYIFSTTGASAKSTAQPCCIVVIGVHESLAALQQMVNSAVASDTTIRRSGAALALNAGSAVGAAGVYASSLVASITEWYLNGTSHEVYLRTAGDGGTPLTATGLNAGSNASQGWSFLANRLGQAPSDAKLTAAFKVVGGPLNAAARAKLIAWAELPLAEGGMGISPFQGS